MSLDPLPLCLLFSSALFCLGLIGALARSNTILVLLGIELMLNAANLAFVAYSRALGALDGQLLVFFVMTVAAAEAAIGLAILVTLFRTRRTINVAEVDTLKG